MWLSYIEGHPIRLPVLETLLADSSSPLGDIELVTSTVAQTEVAFALVEQDKRLPDLAIEAKIDSLWNDKRALRLIEYHTLIAIEARTLIRSGLQYGWSLKPLDAIHLATARSLGVTELHTYDGKLRRYSNQVGFPIMEPYVSGLQPEFPEFSDPEAADNEALR